MVAMAKYMGILVELNFLNGNLPERKVMKQKLKILSPFEEIL